MSYDKLMTPAPVCHAQWQVNGYERVASAAVTYRSR